MSDGVRIRTSLAHTVSKAPMDEAELRRLNAAAYHKYGIAVVDPAKIKNDFLRASLTDYLNNQYGKRELNHEQSQSKAQSIPAPHHNGGRPNS